MLIKINNVEIPEYPTKFSVKVLDIDNDESSTRSANGTLTRDRIAVKRQIDMEWGPVAWSSLSTLLNMMSAVFFDVYYPDPYTGNYVTKTFYAGDRPALVALDIDGVMHWQGLAVTLTEQ